MDINTSLLQHCKWQGSWKHNLRKNIWCRQIDGDNMISHPLVKAQSCWKLKMAVGIYLLLASVIRLIARVIIEHALKVYSPSVVWPQTIKGIDWDTVLVANSQTLHESNFFQQSLSNGMPVLFCGVSSDSVSWPAIRSGHIRSSRSHLWSKLPGNSYESCWSEKELRQCSLPRLLSGILIYILVHVHTM